MSGYEQKTEEGSGSGMQGEGSLEPLHLDGLHPTVFFPPAVVGSRSVIPISRLTISAGRAKLDRCISGKAAL